MPINRESQPSDLPSEEASAVRRTPRDGDEDAHELQEHEFTLEPEDAEAGPFDAHGEHTAPWSTLPLPPLPPWAATARALLEPPTLPGLTSSAYHDEHPTPAAEPIAFSGLELHALRQELALTQRESVERALRLELLDRALSDLNATLTARQLRFERETADQLGRVRGQAFRLAELEQQIRELESSLESRGRALASAEQTAREAEAARASAHQTARDAEAARVSAEAAACEADTARATAEAVARDAEAARASAEAATRDAEAARTTAEAVAREAEAARVNAERIAREAEASAREAWAARATAEERIVRLEQAVEHTLELTARDLDEASEISEPSIEVERLEAESPEAAAIYAEALGAETLEAAEAGLIEAERTIDIEPDAILDAEPDSGTADRHSSADDPVTAARLESTASTAESDVRELEPKRRAARQPRQDDLTAIRGIGKRYAERLNELGISSYARIANWSAADIERIGEQLGTGAKRISRENWVKQAKKLRARAEAARAARPARTARTPRKRA